MVFSAENFECVFLILLTLFFCLADGKAYKALEKGVTFHKGIFAHDTRPATQAHAEQS